MASLIFLSDNYIDDANITLTTGTENAQFPLRNIKNTATVKKFRSIENSVVLRIDLQQTRTINSIALCGDATQSLGLTAASVRFSLTTDFTGFTPVNITLDAQYGMGYNFWENDMSYRYVEITFTGTGVFCEVSNIFIGERLELEQNQLSIGSFGYGYRDKSTVTSNDYGQKFINKRNTVKYIAGDVEHANRAEQEILDNMFIYHQRHNPLWMFVDRNSEGMADGAYKLSIYGYMEDSPDWKASGGRHFNAHIRLDQVV